MGVIDIIKKQEREAGLAAGIEKGRLEERAKIEAEKKTLVNKAHQQACESARMLLELGVEKAKIAKVTGLSIEDIEKLK